jgi:signal transduction histidine kinase/ligand-binding sensor domain-containing protein/CheY-like chemotaxis protein
VKRLAVPTAEFNGVPGCASRKAPLPFAVVILFSIRALSAASVPPDSPIQTLPVIERQDIRFVRLSVGGRPFQKRVVGIAQDNYGFIWLGTDDGLYRYDGYSLKPYRHNPDDPRSLGQNTVLAIYKDREGILWIGTLYGGLDRLDPAQDSFTHYRHNPDDSRSLREDQVLSIYQDRAGALWIGTTQGLDRMDVASGHFFHYPHPSEENPLSYAIWGLYEDAHGNFLVGCALGLYKLDRASGRLSLVPNSSVISSGSGDQDLEWFAKDHSGAPWSTSKSRNILGRFNINTGELRRYALNWEGSRKSHKPIVSYVHEDGNGVLWIGTERDGLLKFDRERKNFMQYDQEPDSAISGQIWVLFEDSEGSLWVGSESGVSRFRTNPLPFVNYQHDSRNPNSLRNNKVLAVHEDGQGFLWIGTAGGLHRLDRKTGQMLFYQHDPRNPTSLSDNAVTAIQEDGSGGLWIGTHEGGLNRFDRASGRFFAYRHNPMDSQSLSNDTVLSLLAEPGGTLWIGTQNGGLDRFDQVTHHFKAYRNDPRDSHSLSFDIVGSIFADRAGGLWVGTNRGLDRFDRGLERFTVYLHDERNPASLSSDGITSISEDHEGALWIGTRDGLNRLDPARGSFERFTTQNGLANDVIQSIREDARGNLWLTTHEGLSRLNLQTRAVQNYSEADGLPGGFEDPTGTERSDVTPEGDLVFGSEHGVTVFNPARVSATTLAPQVAITDFLLFNKPVIPSGNSPLHQPIWATRTLTLNHEQSIFTLEFAALSYTAPERNRYRYKLDDLEKDWNEVGGERHTATYTNLPPGKYVFRVQDSNDDRLWNGKEARLDITVLPPWWATWWFRSLAGMTIAAALLAAYTVRTRALQKAAFRLETQVEERTRELAVAKEAAERANKAKSAFLAMMSHELRTPLNAILGFSALVRDSSNLPEEHREKLSIVNRSGEHLLGLIDDVLDTAKIEAGRATLEKRNFDVVSLVRESVNMMRVRAEDKGLELRLQSSAAVPRFIRSDVGKFRQVLINLMGNAVKFTERGRVTVRLDAAPTNGSQSAVLILEVEDTGLGIAPEDQSRIFDVFVQAGDTTSQKGTGLGLSISQQFVHLMGGVIVVRSTLGEGSVFRVELPVEPVEQAEEAGGETKQNYGEVEGLAPGQPDYRILIVEDRKENWLLLQRLLLDAGFQAQVAENGVRGVEIFRTWRPHLIWMDIRLPVMGGVEAAGRIRLLEGGREVKIVALSASAFSHERERVLAAGLNDFLRKPFRRAEIFDVMSRHLGVRYSYRKARPAHAAKGSGPASLIGLAKIPKPLRDELRDAVILLDSARIGEVVRRVAEHDARLGEILSRAAEQLSYTEVFNALEDHSADLPGESP